MDSRAMLSVLLIGFLSYWIGGVTDISTFVMLFWLIASFSFMYFAYLGIIRKMSYSRFSLRKGGLLKGTAAFYGGVFFLLMGIACIYIVSDMLV